MSSPSPHQLWSQAEAHFDAADAHRHDGHPRAAGSELRAALEGALLAVCVALEVEPAKAGAKPTVGGMLHKLQRQGGLHPAALSTANYLREQTNRAVHFDAQHPVDDDWIERIWPQAEHLWEQLEALIPAAPQGPVFVAPPPRPSRLPWVLAGLLLAASYALWRSPVAPEPAPPAPEPIPLPEVPPTGALESLRPQMQTGAPLPTRQPAQLSCDDLTLLRAEIFARHGYVYDDPALREQLGQAPTHGAPSRAKVQRLLTDTDRAHRDTLNRWLTTLDCPCPGRNTAGPCPR